MKRGHSVSQYLNIISKFKSEIPDLTLAVDIIVGYPTESDDDFMLTVKLPISSASRYDELTGNDRVIGKSPTFKAAVQIPL